MLNELEKEMRNALATILKAYETDVCELTCEAKTCSSCEHRLIKDKVNFAIINADLKEQEDKKPKIKRGMFITFEGPEGAGKSSVCAEVMKTFDNFVLVREPGATPIGEKIRDMVHNDEMPDRSELFLFEAARACLVDSVIEPALSSGKNVLCDRFFDSTTAYQGYGRGLSLGMINNLNSLATDGLTPDLTIVFDIDPAIGMKRKGKATDRIEAAGSDFHNRVRNGFLEMTKGSKRFVKVDASKPLEEVVEEVGVLIKTLLEKA